MHAAKKVLDKILAAISVFLFAVLVLDVGWQVFSREVVGNPSTWSEELARYTFVWLGFFAAALVFSERGHIAVDFVVRKFPERVQRAIAVLVQLTIIAFAMVVLVWGGWRAAMGAWNQNLTALPTTIGPMYLVMPITGVIITLYAIYHVIAVLRREEIAVEASDDAEAV
ncbi:TRAP transporter small permease [Georgenia sp. EYE_87]|uniref:TRAP transporter small permease n=1 Tax=Georgenia sp. EYE_87 TaxID=2853448 RepID=UPI002005D2EB|nr:TRAP transporter small permease [Georgenia sp. EYE_87]MCK6209483.1 TRAP transporter small permease [Georgenia sp. EYE_87]